MGRFALGWGLDRQSRWDAVTFGEGGAWPEGFRIAVYEALVRLPRHEIERFVTLAELPTHHLPGGGGSEAEFAMAAVRYLEQQADTAAVVRNLRVLERRANGVKAPTVRFDLRVVGWAAWAVGLTVVAMTLWFLCSKLSR